MLVYIWEVPGSNLGPQTGYPTSGFLKSSSVPPCNAPNQATPTAFHIIAKSLLNHHPITGCYIALMKQQFVVTHTIHQTDIPALLNSWDTQKKKPFLLVFSCVRVHLFMIYQVLSVSCKTVYQWIMTNCCFMSDSLHCWQHWGLNINKHK